MEKINEERPCPRCGHNIAGIDQDDPCRICWEADWTEEGKPLWCPVGTVGVWDETDEKILR